MSEKKVHKIDIGVVDRPWKYSKNPREEGLIKMLTLAKLNYENVDEEKFKKYEMLVEIENKKERIK